MAASTAPWMKRISSTLLIGLAQLLAEKGIRANAVAPGPIWTPLIPSTMPPDSVVKFGSNVPMKRPGQPAELATTYVMLADPLSSYVSDATISVTVGRPFLRHSHCGHLFVFRGKRGGLFKAS